MVIPERFSDLPEYAFPRLRALLDMHAPGAKPVAMSIGEPQHPMPGFVADVLAASIAGFAKYPPNDGSPDLRGAIAGWIDRRYGVAVDPDQQVMALNGTREGLFNACLALCPDTKRSQRPVVLIPNPFYQVYAVAAAAVGAEPVFVPATQATGFLPDYAGLPADVLDRTAIAYLCSPSNPQGAVADRAYLADVLALAERHDFTVFADECYSEIYRDAPPPGMIAVANEAGADPDRVAIFHSLSKRSNLPGLRSGFVAGGAGALAQLKQLRNYAGAPLPLPLQAVAAQAWSDEAHVVENRTLYQRKYALADRICADVPGYVPPQGGFFLWLPVPDGESAALALWRQDGLRVLPGAYLSRDVQGENPGKGYIRVAMVAPEDTLEDALTRLVARLYH